MFMLNFKKFLILLCVYSNNIIIHLTMYYTLNMRENNRQWFVRKQSTTIVNMNLIDNYCY